MLENHARVCFGLCKVKEKARTSLSALIKGLLRIGLTLDHVYFHRFDTDTDFLKPFDGGFDVGSFAIELEADDADFVGDAALADIGDHGKFLAELPNERLLDQLGRIHQPQTGLLLAIPSGRFGGCGFLGFSGHEMLEFRVN
ncbi:MAG: hypothetical protein JWQ71_1495 [Pedosphaera sp.]|nr:hypothetical protein [Pedosphaera sp.]